MGTTCSRPLPPLPPLPNLPSPAPLISEPHKFQSTNPLPPSIIPPSLPPSLSIPPLPVPLILSHGIVPQFYGTSALLPYPDYPDSGYPDSDSDSENSGTDTHGRHFCSNVSFTDNALNRFLFHHAILGFTRSASTASINFLNSSPPEVVMDDASRFEQTIVSLNLFAISVLLRNVPGFVLCLYESSHFGYAGLEVSVEWFDGAKFWDAYLYGIEEVDRDIPATCQIVEGVNMEGGWRKCWGVIGARENVNVGSMGETMSRLVAEIWRRRPRTGGLYLVADSLVGDRPPLFPDEVFGMDATAFEQVEKEWGARKEVRSEWKEGRERWMASGGTTGVGAVNRERFMREWNMVQGCEELKKVVGAVACGFLRREREEGGAITTFENGKEGVEVVLQARQFCKLREVLCGLGKD